MKSAFWDRRIPTLIGIVLIVIGIGATTFLAKTGLKYFGFAAPTENPQDVRITNVSDTSFTLTYKTDASVIGTISVGKDKDALQTVFDDRDQQSGIPKPYILHSLTVKNLSPKTAYVFSITSGTTTYLNNNNYFQATTGPAISDSPPNAAPLAGKAIEADGTTPTEALIFATTTNGQTISTLVKQSGLYILPLNSMRTADFSSYIPLGANDNLQLLLEDDTNTSHVTVAVSDTNPVPTITIGNDYDFTLTQQPIASTSAQNQFPSFSLDTTIKLTPQITTPQKDESFTDQQPLFKGNALPNQKVTITIHSDTAVNTTVTADSNGNWSYRPTQALAPGNHTISITTTDQFGIIKTIEQSFTVYAAGSENSVVGTPTPTPAAASPTTAPASPTPTHSPTATASPTVAPTTAQLTPTVGVSPTTTSLLLSPTPRPTLPATGSSSVVVAGITGIATTIVGIALFLLTKGAAPL